VLRSGGCLLIRHTVVGVFVPFSCAAQLSGGALMEYSDDALVGLSDGARMGCSYVAHALIAADA
jgi:hypothetical protein